MLSAAYFYHISKAPVIGYLYHLVDVITIPGSKVNALSEESPALLFSLIPPLFPHSLDSFLLASSF